MLGDVYTEVLEAAHPIHMGPTDHKRSVGLLLCEFLVNCWPSGKYVHLLYMYSILDRAPFSLITASIRHGMEVISLWHC